MATKPRTPFTGGAVMHRRGARRATLETAGNETQEKTEIIQAGRARKLGRILLVLSLRSLKLIVSEEICGRFGFVSTDERLHITFLGFGR